MKFQYGHGGDIYGFQGEIVDFSSNINPLGMPPLVKKAYISALDLCEKYPDPFCRELRAEISHHENVPVEKIFCANGAADIIYRLVNMKRPKKALLLAPTFSEYEHALKTVNCQIDYYFLEEKNNFHIKEDFLNCLKGKDMLFLCNPNNPTGQVEEFSLMEKIILAAFEKGITVVVDECFLDFLPNSHEYSVKNLLNGENQLIILKAFTKSYAMAGLRLGYSLNSACEFTEELMLAGQPWGVSGVAQKCGIAALKDKIYLEESMNYIRQERDFLMKEIGETRIKAFDSNANYILLYSDFPLKTALIPKGFLIRDCANYKGLGQGYYRIAVKDHGNNSGLVQAIKEVLGES